MGNNITLDTRLPENPDGLDDLNLENVHVNLRNAAAMLSLEMPGNFYSKLMDRAADLIEGEDND